MTLLQKLSRLNARRRLHKGWIRTELRRIYHQPRPQFLAVLAIMKNESHSIDEWISHYISVGVEKVFLIDNGSTDDTVSKAMSWVKKGRVELVQYSEPYRQIQHYWSAFRHFRLYERYEWLMIADLDEFWFCKNGESFKNYLEQHPGTDVIYTNWSLFGSNGHISQPPSIRTSFTSRDPELNIHTKCIFRTYVADRAKVVRVHDIRRASPYRTVRDNKNLQINHYIVQSRDFFFNVKLKRGDAFYSKVNIDLMMERFQKIDASASFEDTRLKDLVDFGWCQKAGHRVVK